MFFNTIRAEWIKLISTRSFALTSILFVLISTSLSAALTFGIKSTASDAGAEGGFVDATTAIIGLVSLGFAVIIIQAAMVFTSEYRHNTMSVTFTANPKRATVVIAKTLLYGVIASLLTFVTMVVCYYIAIAIAGPSLMGGEQFDPFKDETATRYLWAYPLFIFTIVMLTIGMACLIRQTAGTIAIMLVWYLALEALVGSLPKIGAKIADFLPFQNMMAFITEKDRPDFFLTYNQSLFYYLAICIALFVVGIIVVKRRDTN